MASGVAEFDPVQPAHPPAPHVYPPQHLAMLPHPHYPPAHNPYAPPQVAGAAGVKPELSVDPRYMQYTLPVLAGPQVPGARPPGAPPTVLPYPQGARPPNGVQPAGMPVQRAAAPTAAAPAAAAHRIPQVDGPSSSGSDGSPEPAQYAPRASHPSLPQPTQATQASQNDDEAINSDLDDSDDDEADEEAGASHNSRETVFCTYDKVNDAHTSLVGPLAHSWLGCAGSQQVEVRSQGRSYSHQRQRLPVC